MEFEVSVISWQIHLSPSGGPLSCQFHKSNLKNIWTVIISLKIVTCHCWTHSIIVEIQICLQFSMAASLFSCTRVNSLLREESSKYSVLHFEVLCQVCGHKEMATPQGRGTVSALWGKSSVDSHGDNSKVQAENTVCRYAGMPTAPGGITWD